jgi:hypothetical protein
MRDPAVAGPGQAEYKEAMTYHVRYPSGHQFEVTGDRFLIGATDDPAVRQPTIVDGTRAYVLDPRAVITDATGVVLFQGCTTEELTAFHAREDDGTPTVH